MAESRNKYAEARGGSPVRNTASARAQVVQSAEHRGRRHVSPGLLAHRERVDAARADAEARRRVAADEADQRRRQADIQQRIDRRVQRDRVAREQRQRDAGGQ